MINDAPLARFEPLGSALLKPIYADYSFGNVSNTIHFLLTGEKLGNLLPEDCFGGTYPRPEKIVLFFIDAFGWRSWHRYQDRIPALRRIVADGVLTPMSALFPSTTAASVSTLNLGVLPAEHAVYEWNIYIPAYGEVVQPLPFATLESQTPESCLAKGFDPAELLAVHETVHQRLARHGVRSMQFAARHLVQSSYNGIVSKGAELVPHTTLAEAMLQLRQAVEGTDGKAVFGFYWPSIDSIAHHYSPDSAFHEAESMAFWASFEALLSGMKSPDTLYFFIADHDQISAKAEETIYINERLPELADILPVSPTGYPIYPNGSPRDIFLHVKPERREETLSRLQEFLSGIAEVMPMERAIALGLFGPSTVSEELRRRLGDILVLPCDGRFVGWRVPGIMENRFNGHHGGLAASELVSVFGVTDRL
jgi:predicted AlkP superfamily pyrophosphatase or phosphodiesterase